MNQASRRATDILSSLMRDHGSYAPPVVHTSYVVTVRSQILSKKGICTHYVPIYNLFNFLTINLIDTSY
jgi:hypothetical protein